VYNEGGITDDICKDPLVMLACALETADCPAACKGESTDDGSTVDPNDPTYEVKAGDLDVS
jgi:hypothetical protein